MAGASESCTPARPMTRSGLYAAMAPTSSEPKLPGTTGIALPASPNSTGLAARRGVAVATGVIPSEAVMSSQMPVRQTILWGAAGTVIVAPRGRWWTAPG